MEFRCHHEMVIYILGVQDDGYAHSTGNRVFSVAQKSTTVDISRRLMLQDFQDVALVLSMVSRASRLNMREILESDAERA